MPTLRISHKAKQRQSASLSVVLLLIHAHASTRATGTSTMRSSACACSGTLASCLSSSLTVAHCPQRPAQSSSASGTSSRPWHRLHCTCRADWQSTSKRAEAKAKGLASLAEGKRALARDHFVKAIDVTPEMAFQLIKALRTENVEVRCVSLSVVVGASCFRREPGS